METKIEKVAFAGTELDCVQKDGDIFVSLRRACEGIGIDYSGQLQKLKGHEWATVAIISTVDAAGRDYEMVMVNLDTLGMWLATINANKVSESVRHQLVLYQKEVVKVIRNHFFPVSSTPQNPITSLQMLQSIINNMVEQDQKQIALESKINHVDTMLSRVVDNQSTIALAAETQKKEIEELKQGAKDFRAIPAKTMRTEMVEMVRKYGWAKKMNFGKPWTLLYREFNYRYKINLKVRAKNANVSPLDWAEKHGQLPNLYNLALEMFPMD